MTHILKQRKEKVDPWSEAEEGEGGSRYTDFKLARNSLQKEPHIAFRGHRGHLRPTSRPPRSLKLTSRPTSRPTSRSLEAAEADLEAAEADLEAAEADLEATQGHLRLPINLAYMKTIQKRFSDSQQKSSF